MLLHIDSNNGIPIYEQIVRQVMFAVANGALNVSEHVPSVREMAGLAAVNPNTVARAYRELQSQGILTPIRGMGLAVTTEAPAICRRLRLDMIRERLRSVLKEAAQNQVDWNEIRGLVESEIKRLSSRSSGARS